MYLNDFMLIYDAIQFGNLKSQLRGYDNEN